MQIKKKKRSSQNLMNVHNNLNNTCIVRDRCMDALSMNNRRKYDNYYYVIINTYGL